MRYSRSKHILGAIVCLLVLIAIGTSIVMVLWNVLIPQITGFKVIDFWQAMGLLILCLTLSGGTFLPILAIAHILHPEHRRRSRELRNKWHSMTDEQRREFMASHGFNISKRD